MQHTPCSTPTVEEFLALAETNRGPHLTLRKGQSIWNTFDNSPHHDGIEFAKVFGTDKDCFYDNRNITAFLRWAVDMGLLRER